MIGWYLNPPQHAAVFCVDDKTAIQALDRKDRVLPLSPGRAGAFLTDVAIGVRRASGSRLRVLGHPTSPLPSVSSKLL